MKRVLLTLVFGFQMLASSKATFKTEYAVTTEGNGLPSLERSSMEISAPNVADGITASEIKLELKTDDGAPVVGEEMTLTVSGHQNVVVPCSKSNSMGVSKCRLYSTHAESKRIIAKGKVTLWKDVTFHPVKSSKSATGIVSSASIETLPSGHKIIAASGISEASFVIRDNSGSIQLQSSIQGIALGK